MSLRRFRKLTTKLLVEENQRREIWTADRESVLIFTNFGRAIDSSLALRPGELNWHRNSQTAQPDLAPAGLDRTAPADRD